MCNIEWLDTSIRSHLNLIGEHPQLRYDIAKRYVNRSLCFNPISTRSHWGVCAIILQKDTKMNTAIEKRMSLYFILVLFDHEWFTTALCSDDAVKTTQNEN